VDKKVVLIVDDTKTMRLLLAKCLQDDFSVLEAENGEQAIALFEKNNPDAILLDVEMSGIDGFKTCVGIRKLESGKHVPIMMITGLNDLVSITKAYEAGATDFTTKPITWDIMPHRVHYMIRTSQDYLELQKSKINLNKALIEIQELNKGLEGRVAERTKSLHQEMEKSEKLSKELIVAARQVGMAEVATNVLHNVGNVLNSINVSAAMVVENLKKSRLVDLVKVAELIKTHEKDLANFVTQDSKGQHLPEFIGSLTEVLQSEQGVFLSELVNLTKLIDNVKEIVEMQQTLSGNFMLKEKVSLIDLLDKSIKIGGNDLDRYGIELKRDYADIAPVQLDVNKLMQVLVNLVSNGRDSLEKSTAKHKILSISIFDSKEGKIKIKVEDNGLGIPLENLTKVFSYGFTTKENGHGFGLHASALAIQQMGGTLTVSSDGVGKGASFVIELPIADGGEST
jgi:signal transduction histidine kinase